MQNDAKLMRNLFGIVTKKSVCFAWILSETVDAKKDTKYAHKKYFLVLLKSY